MITPTAVTELASPLIDIYTRMEDDLIRNIASRLSVTDELTGTTKWQIQQLSEMGMLNKQNMRTIAKYSQLSDAHVAMSIAQAGFTSVLADETIYESALKQGATLVIPQAVESSRMIRQILDATVRNAKAEMNLVNTTALETANKLFVDTINQVYLEVNTGTYTYDQAVRKAVKTIGQEGIKGAHYISEKGRETFNQLDVAVKRCIVTSSSQVAGEMQLARADEWGSNYVEVTSHGGARPSHAAWQGKVFMLKGSDNNYQNLVDATGYGSVTGLKGANCSHDFYPFFPGISTQRYHPLDQKENARIYDQSQQQRKLEREIRAEKRKSIAADAAGDKEGLAASNRKIQAKRSELRDFTDYSGRTRRSNREQVVGYTKDIDARARAAAKQYQAKTLPSQKPTIGTTIAAPAQPIKSAPGRKASGVSANQAINSPTTDASYKKMMQSKYSSGSPEAKAIFNKYVPVDSVSNSKFAGAAHYSPLSKKINMNFNSDYLNPRGKGTTFFHEHGHLIDFAAGNVSKNPLFLQALKDDVNSAIMKTHTAVLSSAMSGSKHSAISDLFDGITNHKVAGTYGHPSGYFSQSGNIEAEAFAHFFESEFSPGRRKLIEKYFPTALQSYKSILGGM